MNEMTIQASGTNLFSGSAGTPGGSSAEQAYQRAVKALKEAQKNLSKDLSKGTDAKTLKLDNLAVLQAVAAVAQAQAALAREKAETQQRQAPARSRPSARSDTLSSTLTVVTSLATTRSVVDTYT
jgi:hypothetical protein